ERPEAVGGVHLEPAVVAGRDADEDARRRAGQAGRHDVRVLQRLPGDFQEEALLGVHADRLAGTDAEEGRVEAIDFGEESATRRLHGVEAARRGFPDSLDAVTQQLPEGVGSVRTGEATADANYRHRLAASTGLPCGTGRSSLYL